MDTKIGRVGPKYIISFVGFFAVLFTLIALVYLTQTGVMPYWVYFTIFVPTFIYFQMIMHDIIHYSGHPNRTVNDIMGWIGSFIAGSPLSVLRWSHLAHHKYVDTEKDPDYMLYHLKWYQTWVFLFTGFIYTKHINKLRKKQIPMALAHILICLSVWVIFPVLSFKYWVIPGCVAGFMFGYVFIYAAHNEKWKKYNWVFGPLAPGHDRHHENPGPSLWNWILAHR